MTRKMFLACGTLMLVLFLLSFAPIGEGSTESFGSGGSSTSRGNEVSVEVKASKAMAVNVCPELPVPRNGSKRCSVDERNIQSCLFKCQFRLNFSGSKERFCKPNGEWTGYDVTCEEKTSCDELPVPEHGVKRCTDGNNFGSTCNFTCDDGYELFGNESRKCNLRYKRWSGRDTSCQGSPPTPTCDVDRWDMCDGYYDCEDESDEKGCTCPHYKFKCDCYEAGCPKNEGCFDRSRTCSEWNICGDFSDSRYCDCSDTRFQCKDANCIDRSQVNDGNIDCLYGDDEFKCNKTQGHVSCDCMHDDDRCTPGRCIPNTWIGDTITDCENGSDEPCTATKIRCSGCSVTIYECLINQSRNVLLSGLLRNKTRCHSIFIPTNQSQILINTWICIVSPCRKCLDMFYCDSGQILENSNFCDRIEQCHDGSDEVMKEFGFRCSGKSRKSVCVLPQKNLYDNLAQCSDDSDLCFVNGEFRCFSCLDGKLIVSAKQVCDGKVDCYDMSDECLCANQSVCDAVLGEETSRCPSDQMHCYNDTDCVDMDEVLCNSSVKCKNGRNRMFCHQGRQPSDRIRCTIFSFLSISITIKATQCDGRPECTDMRDECDCEPRPSFCDGSCAEEARINHMGLDVCDGNVDDIYFSGNHSCQEKIEMNCPMRFHCKSKNKISIDIRSVCDGIIDCNDHSDENNTDCRDKRFYCFNGNAVSISKVFVCDGIKDCDNGEDENPQLCRKNDALFSDEYEMISNPILRAFFWIMGILALIGNIIIGLNTMKDVLSCKNTNIIRLANNIFILNLAISDFLMGVYLIAVVTQGQRYSGFYGSVDKEWRSSNLCSGLGTLAVLSSETSAFILACMTSFRLVTIFKSFSTNFIKIKWITITGISCWIISFFLSAIPWFPFDSGYFISDIWFPNLIFQTDTVPKSDMFILAKRVLGKNLEHMSWFGIKEYISDALRFNSIKGEFGYYGETSVCMPRLYATTSEAAWEYSTFLITLNFLLFIYMVVAYVLVYKKVSGTKQCRSTKKDPNKGMQKRISRLLLTDFCCWIPVCMMGYLSVAGVSMPPNAYLVSAGFLLPINSALNPILYSKFIGQNASRAKKWIIRNVSCFSLFAAIEDTVVARTETIELRVIEVND